VRIRDPRVIAQLVVLFGSGWATRQAVT
jgi:hypothetical protein